MTLLADIITKMTLDWSIITPLFAIGGLIVYVLRVKYLTRDEFEKHKDEINGKMEHQAATIYKMNADLQVINANHSSLEKLITSEFGYIKNEIGHLNNNVKQYNQNAANAIARSDEAMRIVERFEDKFTNK